MDFETPLERIIGTELKKEYDYINGYNIRSIHAGSGKPVLLIHGANIGWGAWYRNIGPLSARFQVHAVDLPGSGKSTKINYRTADIENVFVKTIEEYIREKKLDNLTIIGHSIGGWIALKLALKKHISINKIVIASPLGFTNDIPIQYFPLTFYSVAWLLSHSAVKPHKKNLHDFLASVMVETTGLNDHFSAYYAAAVQESPYAHPFFLLHRLFGFLKLKKELMLTDKLSSILCPVLVIMGDQDPLIPLKKIKKSTSKLPKGEFCIFPSTGHVPPLEKHKEFNRKILDFMLQ